MKKELLEIYKEGNYEECLELSEILLRNNKSDLNALCFKGACLSRLGRHKEAVIALSACLEIRDDIFFIWSARGDSYYELGEYEKASEDFRHSLELKPEDHVILDMRARALFRMGQVNDALPLIKQAVESNQSPEPVLVMVHMLKSIGQISEANKVACAGAAYYIDDTRFDPYRN